MVDHIDLRMNSFYGYKEKQKENISLRKTL